MITHERREALLQLISDALKAADKREHDQNPKQPANEHTGWFSDELCDAHTVVHALFSDWLRDAEEYFDQRADVDDGRPNAAMRLYTDLQEAFKDRLPFGGKRERPEQGDPNEGVR